MFLSLICLLFVSCGPKRSSANWITSQVGPLTMKYPLDTTVEEQKLLEEAAQIQLTQFTTDWGSESRPVTVYFFRGDTVKCGLAGDAIGCHFGRNGPIDVIMGDYYEIPALYHELIHHNIEGNDHQHEDPRWETFWEPMQYNLLVRIVNMRFALILPSRDDG